MVVNDSGVAGEGRQGSMLAGSWTPKYHWLVGSLAVLMMVPLSVLYMNMHHATLAGVLSTEAYWQGQVSLFIYLNQLFTAWPAGFLYNLTLLGDAAVLLPLAMLGGYCRAQVIGALMATLPIGALMSSVGKKLFAMPRPGAVLDANEFNAIGELLTGHSSLPSGHSLTYFAVGIALLVTWRPIWHTGRDKWLGVLALGVLFGLCFSRVAVGAHWPLDLLVGGSLGTMAGWIGATLANKYTHWWQAVVYGKGRWLLMLGMALWCWALVQRTPHVPYNPIVIYLAALACIAVIYGLLTSAKAPK